MNLDVLRRIAERGLKHAQREEDSIYCDVFQHMLDEIEHARIYDNNETIRAFRKFAEKVHDPKIKEMSKPDALATIAEEIVQELEVERKL